MVAKLEVITVWTIAVRLIFTFKFIEEAHLLILNTVLTILLTIILLMEKLAIMLLETQQSTIEDWQTYVKCVIIDAWYALDRPTYNVPNAETTSINGQMIPFAKLNALLDNIRGIMKPLLLINNAEIAIQNAINAVGHWIIVPGVKVKAMILQIQTYLISFFGIAAIVRVKLPALQVPNSAYLKVIMAVFLICSAINVLSHVKIVILVMSLRIKLK